MTENGVMDDWFGVDQSPSGGGAEFWANAAFGGEQATSALTTAQTAAEAASVEAQRILAEAQTAAEAAIATAQATAQSVIDEANAAITALSAEAEPTEEELAAEVVEERVAEAARRNRLDSVQDLSALETERLFRMFGAKAAFGGSSRSVFG